MASIEELQIGQSDTYERIVTERDIEDFAKISGDDNPVHLNEDFAKTTIFKGRIAHGMLAASFISTTVGTKLPGYGAIYISQNLRFKAPVKIGDKVITTATIKDINTEKKRVTMSTICAVGEKIVVEGEAELMLT